MTISLIAAIDANSAIGYKNKLLFKNHEDMQFFKQHTYAKPIIMGKNTYESIGKPLRKRINYVLTTDKKYNPHPDVLVRHNIESILHELKDDKEVAVIGGSNIYQQFIDIADRIYLTKVHHTFGKADSYFPRIPDGFKEYYYREGSEGLIPYSFHILKKPLK